MTAAGDRLLRQVVSRRPRPLVVMILAAVTAAVSGLLLPDAIARAVDAALRGQGASIAVLWFVGLAVTELVSEVVEGVVRARVSARATADLRRRTSEHLIALGDDRRFAPGESLSRVTGDCAEAGEIAVTMTRLGVAAVTTVGAVTALVFLDWRLAVVFLLGVPPALLLAKVHLARTADDVAAYQRVSGELSAGLLDAVRGLRTIQAAGVADRETGRVLAPLPRLSAAGAGIWRVQARMVWRAALLLPAVELTVLVTAGLLLSAGELTVGDLFAALGYAALGMALVRQAPLVTALAGARAAADRVAEVLDRPTPPTGGGTDRPGAGAVELRGVSVGQALREVDLTVPAGALVAVVGRSGAGKSLLAAVIGGLVRPDRGEVSWDGAPLADLREEAVRATVAFAFERPALLGETVADAVGYGTEASRAEVTAACVAARAHDLVVRLPSGYDTPLGDTPLSGGEAQRLGLARALVRDPMILILDDATASLDAVTESEVDRAIAAASVGRTRVVTTHRISVAERADLVVWLEAGRVLGVGPHARLRDRPGYSAVFGGGG